MLDSKDCSISSKWQWLRGIIFLIVEPKYVLKYFILDLYKDKIFKLSQDMQNHLPLLFRASNDNRGPREFE